MEGGKDGEYVSVNQSWMLRLSVVSNLFLIHITILVLAQSKYQTLMPLYLPVMTMETPLLSNQGIKETKFRCSAKHCPVTHIKKPLLLGL